MIDKRINPDESVDRVLAALRAVEAPQQMERRILDNIQRRATTQSEPAFVLASFFVPSRRWAIAGSVVILSLAAWMAVHKRNEAVHEVAVLNRDTAPMASPATVSESPAQSGRGHRRTLAVVSLHEKSSASPEDINDLDALAISEMNAPSKPAPPLPLTHQEELLAETLHQTGAKDLSSLRPEVRAKQMELSKAEFHDFFEPPPAKESE